MTEAYFDNGLCGELTIEETFTPDDINYWIPTGFKKVCKVNQTRFSFEWYYTDIDHTLMYSEHRSWVYFITVNGKIWKIGETGNPLGIKGRFEYGATQPITGTKSRLGRYRSHKAASHGREIDTDERCRSELAATVSDPKCLVEFWAFKCPETLVEISIGSGIKSVSSHIHKHTEKMLIDHYQSSLYCLPPGNRAKA